MENIVHAKIQFEVLNDIHIIVILIWTVQSVLKIEIRVEKNVTEF